MLLVVCCCPLLLIAIRTVDGRYAGLTQVNEDEEIHVATDVTVDDES